MIVSGFTASERIPDTEKSSLFGKTGASAAIPNALDPVIEISTLCTAEWLTNCSTASTGTRARI